MLTEQVIEYREIVHRKIRDHVYVALEQAQIYADRVVVVHPSELSALDDFTHLPDRPGVDEGVIDEKHTLAPPGFVGQFARLKRSLRHRFFEPEMLPGSQGSHAKF